MLDGLIHEPHNQTVLDLLFVFGCWHAYAKLRLHTEDTLASFENITVDLGGRLRRFASVTCGEFRTMELPKERAARIRRTANTANLGGNGSGGARLKTFNLNTYKLHALGDYPQTIRERGTTDNYTTQWVVVHSNMLIQYGCSMPTKTIPQVELTHCNAKALYPLINKHNPERDIGRMQRRQEILEYLDRARNRNTMQITEDTYQEGHTKTSDGGSSTIGLKEFLAIQRGQPYDPAKRVSENI